MASLKNEEISSDTILGVNALLNNTNLGNNTAIGYRALRLNGDGFQNTSVGAYALEKNIKTHNNTGLGYKALSESVGEYNTGVGALCGQTLKTGVKNVLVGKHADVSKLNADNQIVIGQGAVGLLDNSVTLGNVNVNNVFMSQDKTAHVHCGNLTIYDNKGKKVYTLPRTAGEKGHILRTNGKGVLTWIPNIEGAVILNGLEDCTTELLNKNMFIGAGVGANNTADGLADFDGKRNTALGIGSLAANTTGYQNVCFGSDALKSNITGNKNVAFGYNAGDSITDGTDNTCIGDSSSVDANQTYSIALGSNASVSTNNTMVIGGSTNVGNTNNTITSILPGKTGNTTLGSTTKKFENIHTNNVTSPNITLNLTNFEEAKTNAQLQAAGVLEGMLYTVNNELKYRPVS